MIRTIGKLNICTCERCTHEWASKITPVRCAKCRSKYWNKKRRARIIKDL